MYLTKDSSCYDLHHGTRQQGANTKGWSNFNLKIISLYDTLAILLVRRSVNEHTRSSTDLVPWFLISVPHMLILSRNKETCKHENST